MAIKMRFLGNRNDADTIGSALAKMLDKHSSAFFAVAYGAHKPFLALDNRPALPQFIKRGSRLRAVFDIDRQFTDPDLIDELFTIPGDVECRLFASSLTTTTNPLPSRFFHSKVYFFESATSNAAIVGSGNFSPGGMRDNFEAAIETRGPTESQPLRDIRAYCQQIWDSPYLISVDEFEDFREEYANAYRAARKKQAREGNVPTQIGEEDKRRLKKALEFTKSRVLEPRCVYILGLIAGGCRRLDYNSRVVEFDLRRYLLNRDKPEEGRVVFTGISERNLYQTDCVRRDAERVFSRLETTFRDLGTEDKINLEARSELSYRFTLRFDNRSSIWLRLRKELKRIPDNSPKYVWPRSFNFIKPEIRRAFLQGYMDIRTRITATDALPQPTPFTRVAVSVGKNAIGFAKRFREAMASEFECDIDRINLLDGASRNRETLIRADARIIPWNFFRSPWQQMVVADFRAYNERLAEQLSK